MKFDAAVLVDLNHPLEIISVETPVLRSAQVLVRIIETGICRSQIQEIDGGRGNEKWLPHMLGHEGVGIVEEVAKDVTKVVPGDRVVLTWLKCSGRDAGGTVYSSQLGKINAGRITTFSEYSVVSEDRLFKVDDSVSSEIAPLLGCAIPTGAGIVLNNPELRKSSSIAVFGLGGVGFSALIALVSLGFKNVTVFDVDPKKLSLASLLGVEFCIDVNHVDVTEYNSVFDFVIECAGHIETIETALKLTNTSGTLIFASHPPIGRKLSIDPHELISGKKIFGSWGGGCCPETQINDLNDVFGNQLDIIKHIRSKSYSLSDINSAILDFKNGDCVRAIIGF